ncbi:MAG: tol-pal system YbgF family protein [Pyrinomonadaceae bacterium]
MIPRKLRWQFSLFVLLLLTTPGVLAQRRRPPGGRLAVIADERLSALRSTPELSAKLLRRLSRGSLVAIRGAKTNRDGVSFFLVNVSSRTHGWIQRESLVVPSQRGDDVRLLYLIEHSTDFERISRARIFLEYFPRSPLRAQVLLMFGDAAEDLGAMLSRDAARRLRQLPDDVPESSYFLNYVGLDRYNRQGITFVFDRQAKLFHYDGRVWREIVRYYPGSHEAAEARKRLRMT